MLCQVALSKGRMNRNNSLAQLCWGFVTASQSQWFLYPWRLLFLLPLIRKGS